MNVDRVNSYNSEMLLIDNYYPLINAYYYKEFSNQSSDVHYHRHVEIMYVIKGNCIIQLDDKEVLLKDGEFIIINNGILHKLIVNENVKCRMMNIEFSFSNKNKNYLSIKELATYSSSIKQLLKTKQDYLILKDMDEIYYIMKDLITELDSKNDDIEIITQMLISQMFVKIGRYIKEAKLLDKNTGIGYIKKAMFYIKSNYDYSFTIDDVAEYVSVHPVYLQRIFKKYTNMTIINYVTNIRIEKAKMLLANTDILITDIPSYVGINSVQYFDKLFKKYTYETPLQYRKQHKIEYQSKDYRTIVV